MRPALLVIGGTTASGKSQLALRLARASGGVVVNADSMQLYRDLRILTARPAPAEEALVPHALYGVLDAAETGSVGRWLELVAPVLARCRGEGRPALVVGGTGLYLEALLDGLAPVPEIPPALRARLRAEAAGLPAPELHRRLAVRDPAMAARLRPSDPQRSVRALEVLEATGRSLADWQAAPRLRLALPGPVVGIALVPPPALVGQRIAQRLDRMVAAGGLDELRRLLARSDLPPDAPLLRATGVPELRAVLEGRSPLAEGLARAAAATRRYAKRQRTFLRHRLAALRAFAEPEAAARAALEALHAAPQHGDG